MNFSYEEIFSMYGQYDTFVSLLFHPGTEASKTYGPRLMGTFLYTLEERKGLEKAIQGEAIPRTNQHIKFRPSKTEERLSNDQKEALDRQGILNGDIFEVSTVNLPRQNRFKVTGDRDIPNTIEVNFDPTGVEWNRFKLGMFSSRLVNGYPLIDEERLEYLALMLYYTPTKMTEAENREAREDGSDKLKVGVRHYYLEVKFFNEDLDGDENKEFTELQSIRSKAKVAALVSEFQRSSERLKDLAVQNKDTLYRMVLLASQFDDEVILPYKFPIWWNFERFIHIYIRHVKETKVGERFADKTIFQYKLRDIRRIVSAVVKLVYEEVVEHFKTSKEPFRRMGKRAIYFDGVYYRVEIESNGLLRTFHPENDNED